jgi:hypothetical protein
METINLTTIEAPYINNGAIALQGALSLDNLADIAVVEVENKMLRGIKEAEAKLKTLKAELTSTVKLITEESAALFLELYNFKIEQFNQNLNLFTGSLYEVEISNNTDLVTKQTMGTVLFKSIKQSYNFNFTSGTNEVIEALYVQRAQIQTQIEEFTEYMLLAKRECQSDAIARNTRRVKAGLAKLQLDRDTSEGAKDLVALLQRIDPSLLPQLPGSVN